MAGRTIWKRRAEDGSELPGVEVRIPISVLTNAPSVEEYDSIEQAKMICFLSEFTAPEPGSHPDLLAVGDF